MKCNAELWTQGLFLKGERVTPAGHNMYCSHFKDSQWVESKWIVGGEWAEPADVNSSVWCWCGRVSSGSAAEDWVHKEHNMSERKGKSHQSHTLEKDSLKRGASQRGRQDIWSFLEREMMSSDSFSSEKQQQIYKTMLRQPVLKLHRITGMCKSLNPDRFLKQTLMFWYIGGAQYFMSPPPQIRCNFLPTPVWKHVVPGTSPQKQRFEFKTFTL